MLYKSIKADYLPGIEQSINNGASINETTLTDAVGSCGLETIKYLLKRINFKYSYNILLKAIQEYKIDIFLYLFELNADYYKTSTKEIYDINMKKFIKINIASNLLNFAIHFKVIPIIKFLLVNGGNPKLINKEEEIKKY